MPSAKTPLMKTNLCKPWSFLVILPALVGLDPGEKFLGTLPDEVGLAAALIVLATG